VRSYNEKAKAKTDIYNKVTKLKEKLSSLEKANLTKVMEGSKSRADSLLRKF
jgi:hypothetical protein